MQGQGFELGWAAVAGAAWRHARSDWAAVLKPATFWLGVTAISFGTALLSGQLTGSTGLVIALCLFSLMPALIGAAVVAINWHRQLLLRETTTSWSGLDSTPGIWGYAWRAGLIGVVGSIATKILIALGYIPASVMGTDKPFMSFLDTPPMLVLLPVLAVQFVIVTRLGTRLPAYAVDDATMDTARAWKETGKYNLHMCVTYVAMTLMFIAMFAGTMLVVGSVGAVFGGYRLGLILGIIMLLPLSYLVLLYGLSVLTLYYAALIGRRDLFDPTIRPPRGPLREQTELRYSGYTMNIPGE